MKKIIIDARMYGPKNTGIGRYIKNLLINLPSTEKFKDLKITLLIYKNQEQEIRNDLGNKYDYITTNIRHYSIGEQIVLPWFLYLQKADLVHFTNFNKPILYLKKSVVTIHDLIKHFSKGPNTTTRHPLLYWIKYIGYLIATWVTIKTSTIIVPSNYWKKFIENKYGIKNITTTYEAVDDKFMKHIDDKVNRNRENYLLYTGNIYPHKNIEVIFRALKHLDVKLKIICGRSVFTDRARRLVQKNNLTKKVEFLGFVEDGKFLELYSKALALVHPSYIEGFSLTGLEALALGCPVIASNTSCMPEVYGDSVIFFNPDNETELIENINYLKNHQEVIEKMVEKGRSQVKKYSWKKMAKETMAVYDSAL